MPVIQFVKSVARRIARAYRLRGRSPQTTAKYLRGAGAQIGRDCFIVPDDLGSEPFLIRIGNHVAIADGVSFLSHDAGAWIFRGEIPDLQGFGPIVIEDNCFIGQRAILGPNIHVGPNSVVAAGSLVIADVPPNTLVMGVPARPFGSLAKYGEKCLAKWSQQRPPRVALSPSDTWWSSPNYASNRERLKAHLLDLFHDRLSR